ncbi:MAG: efflux transporter periplasmic adaptor subunit, partial [Persephonella sp.]
MKKKILIFLSIIFVLVIAVLLFKKFSHKEQKIKVLESVKVKRGDIKDVIDATAIVKTQVNAYVKVGARATGEIQEMNVDIGDYVKKGELIAVIDQRELKKEVDRLKAELKKSEANLQEIEKVYPLKIKEAEENLKKAKANYDYAVWNFNREKELLKKGFTTKKDYEKAEMDMKTAKANLDYAEASLRRLKKEYKVKLKEAKSSLNSIKENLEKAKIRLSYTEIYSPIDGVVSKITARKGETVVAGLQVANLITILNPKKLEVRIYVDETDIGKVKEGQKVIYYVDAYPNKRFEGVISKIYPEPIVKENIVYYMAIV